MKNQRSGTTTNEASRQATTGASNRSGGTDGGNTGTAGRKRDRARGNKRKREMAAALLAGTALLLAPACAVQEGREAADGTGAAAAERRADLLLLGGTIVTMDDAGTVIDDGGTAVVDGKIAEVGTAAALRESWSAAETVELGSHDIVAPGLINGHNHAAMTLLRGVADDLELMEWLEGYIFPAEAAVVDEEFVRVGTRLAALEMIRSGTTTFTDMYYFEDVVAEVVDEAGLRGILGETVIGFPAPDSPDPDSTLAYARDFIERWKGHPRVIPAVAPHAPYTVGPEVLRRSAALAREHGVPLLIHLSESEAEVAQVEERYGRTSTAHLAEIGFLGPDVIGFHALWLTDEDIAALAEHGVGVVHNPESNMKLASGTMRVVDLRAAGVPVGLGTDGPASNNDLDLFAAVTLAGFLQKQVRGDPTALPAEAAFGLATREGAAALHMGERIGSLEPGKAADLVVLDGDAPNLVPRYDALSHLAYAARGGNVRMTVVAGRVLYRDGEFTTLDPNAVVAAARRLAGEVRRAVQ